MGIVYSTGAKKCTRKVGDPAEVHTHYLLPSNDKW